MQLRQSQIAFEAIAQFPETTARCIVVTAECLKARKPHGQFGRPGAHSFHCAPGCLGLKE